LAGYATGDWLIGGLLMASHYIGRELTQAEYRWIAAYGSGLRANMPWWGRFDPRVWNVKSLSDWLSPLIAAMVVYFI
jgi:hypothetical protein